MDEKRPTKLIRTDDKRLVEARTRYQQVRAEIRALEKHQQAELATAKVLDSKGRIDADAIRRAREFDTVLAQRREESVALRRKLRKLEIELNPGILQLANSGKHSGVFKQGGEEEPTCTLVDDYFTAFLGARASSDLFQDLDLYPSEDNVHTARITAWGSNTSGTFSAQWGLEITDDFLTGSCGLELGAAVHANGLADTGSGGSVSVTSDSYIYIYRAPGVALDDVLYAGIEPIASVRTVPFGNRTKVDNQTGLHSFGEYTDSISVIFGDYNAFILVQGADYSVVVPGYKLKTGDKIFTGSWMEFIVDNSTIQFELNDVGTTSIRAVMEHRKWVSQ